VIRRRLTAALLLAALVGAGCGTSVPTGAGTTSPGISPAPSGTASGPEPSDVPASSAPETEPPAQSEAPSASQPADTPDVPSPSAATTGAEACTGNAANREFFAGVASAVDWPVMCAVLPKGWFVNTGSYRLANGGRMVISYKGPGGATLALSEGAFCKDSGGCVPSGSDAGDAAFGPLGGTLVRLDDGGFAIVVERGANPSWLLEAHGLDEATTMSFGSALHQVGG
jgi:hypothetical protein